MNFGCIKCTETAHRADGYFVGCLSRSSTVGVLASLTVPEVQHSHAALWSNCGYSCVTSITTPYKARFFLEYW